MVCFDAGMTSEPGRVADSTTSVSIAAGSTSATFSTSGAEAFEQDISKNAAAVSAVAFSSFDFAIMPSSQ